MRIQHISQARAGDTVNDLVARADMDLYRQKKERKDRSQRRFADKGSSLPVTADDSEATALANFETGQK